MFEKKTSPGKRTGKRSIMLNRVVFIYFVQAERIFAVILIQIIRHILRSKKTKCRRKVVSRAECVGELWECEISSIMRNNACPRKSIIQSVRVFRGEMQFD